MHRPVLCLLTVLLALVPALILAEEPVPRNTLRPALKSSSVMSLVEATKPEAFTVPVGVI